MHRTIALVIVAACGKDTAKPTIVGSGSAPTPVAATPACDLAGSYRLRYSSNGVDGWWLRLAVAGKDVKLAGKLDMLGLDEPGPLETVLDDKACTLALAKKTKQAGDLKIALKVDGAKVTGTVARTANGDDKPTSPITGLREIAPPKLPACIHPGAYELSIANVKTWALQGSPRVGDCKAMAPGATTHVRVEVLGDMLFLDEVTGQAPYDQSFGRSQLVRTGECEATLAIEVQDFKIATSKIVFAGDAITGKTTSFTYQFMENGTAGENLWSCTTTDGDVSGKRVGD